MDSKSSTPGLKWQRRTSGPPVPLWVADEKLVKRGFLPKTVNLSAHRDDPEALSDQCNDLSTRMQLWAAGYRKERFGFTGSIGSLLDAYKTHPKSSLRRRRPGTQVTYGKYIKMLRDKHGHEVMDSVTGEDLLDWRDNWIKPRVEGAPAKVAAAVTARAVLMAAAKFGISQRFAGARDFYEVIKATPFDKPASRTQVLTAEQVAAARKAAHANGQPRRALAYAITFETGLRLSDVVGLWLPLDAAGVSTVFDGSRKWIGLRFEDMVDGRLNYTPSKTILKTGKAISVDLTLCPMVLEELAHVPADQRQGPAIIDRRTGRPYEERYFRESGWHRDFRAAGIPKGVWARDMRASGSTEARQGGASVDDTTKFLGKTDRRATATVYDRDTFEAHRRVARARLTARNSAET